MKVAVLIDGGYLRVQAQRQQLPYTPAYIEKTALTCVAPEERLLKILYYDCAPYPNEITYPISGRKGAPRDGQWLHELSYKDYFAVRRGVLKFRGFKLKKSRYMSNGPLRDEDFVPDLEQKGVDMRIGLDIASMSETKSVDRIILITGDTDCIPAMKHARKAGLQVVLIELPGRSQAKEMLAHTDLRRLIQWPAAPPDSNGDGNQSDSQTLV